MSSHCQQPVKALLARLLVAGAAECSEGRWWSLQSEMGGEPECDGWRELTAHVIVPRRCPPYELVATRPLAQLSTMDPLAGLDDNGGKW
ncbi:hypothetical protein CALVIDRAFT_438563 [Calocera viscosa TUFC12733]|uniref:Secreted protein n=1 Tax=Calocera viscosa (strain TUFC12733) TaxID=1330018 RepID=A0A167FSW3_CALVF|nr:hypothetical protein CALVIDRAFT_438563 [Calocera viscosa TUFC12733]